MWIIFQNILPFHTIHKKINYKILADSLKYFIPRNIICKIKHFRTQPQHNIKMHSDFFTCCDLYVFRNDYYLFLFHNKHFTNGVQAAPVVLSSLLCHRQWFLVHIIFILMASLCHALSFSVLCTTTFCVSCSLNLNGELFGYVSHRQDNKLAPDTGNFYFHHIQGLSSFLYNLQTVLSSQCSLPVPSQEAPPCTSEDQRSERPLT